MNAKTLHLSGIQVGTEVVAIFVNPSQTREKNKYGEVCKILGKDPIREGWLATGLAKIPLDGKGYFAMHSKETPHFYWSANPKHIRAAESQAAKLKKAREKKETLLAAKRKEFAPLLESYRDSEECYTFEYLPTEELERLTIRQIKTLKKWLNK